MKQMAHKYGFELVFCILTLGKRISKDPWRLYQYVVFGL